MRTIIKKEAARLSNRVLCWYLKFVLKSSKLSYKYESCEIEDERKLYSLQKFVICSIYEHNSGEPLARWLIEMKFVGLSNELSFAILSDDLNLKEYVRSQIEQDRADSWEQARELAKVEERRIYSENINAFFSRIQAELSDLTRARK